MFTVLLGILAAVLGGAGVLAKHPAQDRPLDQCVMVESPPHSDISPQAGRTAKE